MVHLLFPLFLFWSTCCCLSFFPCLAVLGSVLGSRCTVLHSFRLAVLGPRSSVLRSCCHAVLGPQFSTLCLSQFCFSEFFSQSSDLSSGDHAPCDGHTLCDGCLWAPCVVFTWQRCVQLVLRARGTLTQQCNSCSVLPWLIPHVMSWSIPHVECLWCVRYHMWCPAGPPYGLIVYTLCTCVYAVHTCLRCAHWLASAACAAVCANCASSVERQRCLFGGFAVSGWPLDAASCVACTVATDTELHAVMHGHAWSCTVMH